MLTECWKSTLRNLAIFAAAAVCACSNIANGGLFGSSLEANRKKWEASGITSYRMKTVVQKTGHAAPMGTFLITVRDGKVESVLAGGSPGTSRGKEPDVPISDSDWLNRFSPYDTIEDYFKIIDKAEEVSNDIFETAYEPTLGYPRRLRLDPKKSTMDDELLVEVLTLEKLD